MAKRHQTGPGRRGPEPDYQREMRQAFERTTRETPEVDNRTLIPQLMRELIEVHGARRVELPQPQPKGSCPHLEPQLQETSMLPKNRHRRRAPTPYGEQPKSSAQVAQPGPSSQVIQRSAASWSRTREFTPSWCPKVKEAVRNHLMPAKPSKPTWEGRSLRSYVRERQRDSGDTFECIDATEMTEDAENQQPSRQLNIDEQFELDTMLAIERSLEECFTPVGKPFPEVHVPVKDEDSPIGEVTVKADVHQGGTTAMKLVSGGQLPSKYPDHWAAAERFSDKPLYAEPIKKKDRKVARMESPTLSSASSSDRPSTPLPRSWLPVAMKYLDATSPQKVFQHREFEDRKQKDFQYMLNDEEQFELDTQLVIQRSLQDLFAQSRARPVGGNEIMMMARQEKQEDENDSGILHTNSPQPTRYNVMTPAGKNAQYAEIDATEMLTAEGEAETNDVTVTLLTVPPKPPHLYVRGINDPPGMMEPVSSVVPRISNVQCPSPDPNDQILENDSPETSAEPQQDVNVQQQPKSCCGRFMQSFRNGISAGSHYLRLLGNYTWQHLCHCSAIRGSCARE